MHDEQLLMKRYENKIFPDPDDEYRTRTFLQVLTLTRRQCHTFSCGLVVNYYLPVATVFIDLPHLFFVLLVIHLSTYLPINEVKRVP
jgi:hypothetical protein